MDDSNNQPKGNDTSSPMLSRSAQILQAAAPYLDQDSTHILESVVRMTDFFETIQSIRQRGFSSIFQKLRPGNDTVSMTNLSQAQPAIDSEALLRSIRPFCSLREGTIIDQIMNFFNIQRAFSMYQTITNMMSMMNSMNGNDSNENSSSNANPFMNMPQDMGQMMNMASMMSQMMNSSSNMDTEAPKESNPQTDKASNEQQSNETDIGSDSYQEDTYWNSKNMNYRHSYGSKQDTQDFTQQNHTSNAYQNSSNTTTYNPEYSYTQNMSNPESSPTESATKTEQENNTTGNNSNNNSKQMLDMLSTMIPPEQKSTFEAMKLLVESGIIK